MGPRAGRALDRAAHGRGGLRARRRRERRRRREAARRARRRALPGPLPLAAARGARRRGPGRRSPSTCHQKLIRRHPHVFGEVEAETPARCCATGTRSSAPSPAARRASSARCPRTSRRCCTRARSSAARRARASTSTASPTTRSSGELEELEAAGTERDAVFDDVGDLLFAAVNVARKLHVDPELALRAASGRFRGRVEAAEELAAAAAPTGTALTPDDKLTYYAQARLNE